LPLFPNAYSFIRILNSSVLDTKFKEAVIGQISEITLELAKEKKETMFQDEFLEDFFQLGGDMKLLELLELNKQCTNLIVDFFQSLFVYGGRNIDEFANAQRGKLNEVDRFFYDCNKLFTHAFV